MGIGDADEPLGHGIGIGDEVRDIEAAHHVHVAAMAVSWGYGAAPALSAAVP